MEVEGYVVRYLRGMAGEAVLPAAHPLARLVFCVLLLCVWFVSDPRKIGLVFVVTLLMLFTVPTNPVSQPRPFLLAVAVFLFFELSAHAALGWPAVSVPLLVFGTKLLCLAASVVILGSGLRIQGVLYLSSFVSQRLSLVTPSVASALPRIEFAFEQIRRRQRASGIRLLSEPVRFVCTLLYRLVYYLILLSEDYAVQVTTKWYGSRHYATRLDLVFRAGDWVLCVFGLALLLVMAFF